MTEVICYLTVKLVVDARRELQKHLMESTGSIHDLDLESVILQKNLKV
jgi:hypothetical protein